LNVFDLLEDCVEVAEHNFLMSSNPQEVLTVAVEAEALSGSLSRKGDLVDLIEDIKLTEAKKALALEIEKEAMDRSIPENELGACVRVLFSIYWE
jgi:hypothetical protein